MKILRKINPYPCLLLMLLSAVVFLGCSGKHPADVVAPAIMIGTDTYQGIEDTLVRLHDGGAPTIVANWQQISNVRWAASKRFRSAWRAWYQLSLINNPQNQQQLNEQLAAFAELLAQLLSFIPVDESNFKSLQDGVIKVKEAGNGTR